MPATNPRQLAVERRENALKEAARWADFLVMYDELHGIAEAPTASEAKPQRQTDVTHDKPTEYKITRVRPALARETSVTAHKLILMAGHPLPTREVLAVLSESGHEVGGKDPIATLTARLGRSPDLLWFDKATGWNAKVTRVAAEEGWHRAERTAAQELEPENDGSEIPDRESPETPHVNEVSPE